MFDWLRRALGPSRSEALTDADWNNVNNNAVFNLILGSKPTRAGVKVSELTAMSVPAVWACVSLIAEQVAQCPVALFKRDGENRVKDTEHPLALLLQEPNTPAGLGMPDLIKQQQVQAGLWGDGYWQIERGPSGAPVALWPLDSAVTQPMTEDNPRARAISSYRTVIGKTSEDLKPADVVHFRRMTLSGYVGWAPIQAARNAIGLAIAMENFGSEFFKNEAVTGGYVLHPGKLSKVARENVRSSVEDQRKDPKGNVESHRLQIFEEGMKFIPTTITPEQSQFLGSREFAIAEAARLYRIPLVLLQSLQGSTVWGTGIESLMVGFVNQTIRPIIVSAQDELGRKLLTPEERLDGYEIDIDESVLLVGNATDRADVNLKASGGPWITTNEARRRDGLNPIAGGDEIKEPKPAAPAPGAPPSKGPKKDDA